MANQFNQIIATQTVAFRGLSQVGVRTGNINYPNSRTITGAVYSLLVTGGISGTFGVNVVGIIGGATYTIAGVTAITAAGSYILYPVGYSSTGAGGAVGAVSAGVNAIHRIDHIVPPYYVGFQSAVATVGISANCTVALASQVNK
jgi:hypothetical protein